MAQFPGAGTGQVVGIARGRKFTGGVSGELAGTGAGFQGPDVACELVVFKARYNNAGRVWIGTNPNIAPPSGADNLLAGYELSPGESSPWIPVSNVNVLYFLSETASDDILFLAL